MGLVMKKIQFLLLSLLCISCSTKNSLSTNSYSSKDNTSYSSKAENETSSSILSNTNSTNITSSNIISSEESSSSTTSILENISTTQSQKIEQYIKQLIKEGVKVFNFENANLQKFHYSDALYMNALLAMYNSTKDEFYLNKCVSYLNNFINLSKKKYILTPYGGQLDSIPGGEVLLKLYEITNNDSYLSLTSRMDDILKAQPRLQSEGNNFYHKVNYPNQVWLDGLYMAMPYYIHKGSMNKNNNYEDIYKQYKFVRDNMQDKDTLLYYHGYDDSNEQDWSKYNVKNPKCSRSIWGRGMGWVIASLSDVISNMNPLNEKEESYKKYLEEMLKEAIENIYKYADEKTNLFYQVIDKGNKEGNYLETSASSLITYGTLKAFRLNIIDEEYYLKALKTFNSILDYKLLFDEKNNRYYLKDINSVAGLSSSRDGSYEYYVYNETTCNDNAKGSAPLIMAYSELLMNM